MNDLRPGEGGHLRTGIVHANSQLVGQSQGDGRVGTGRGLRQPQYLGVVEEIPAVRDGLLQLQ